MIVRRAALEDWPRAAALLAELGRPDVTGHESHARAFARYLQRDDAVALVAVDAGVVIGFCDLEFRPRLAYHTPQAWIPDLVVTESARSRGAGAALLARAEELSRERGCWSLTLESANWRTRAHAFYLREGLADVAKAFGTSLTADGWLPAPPPPTAKES